MTRLALFIILCGLAIMTDAHEPAARPDTIMAPHSLGEVTVNADRPRIKGENGIITVDLPAIVRDKPVTNILEALPYLPGVREDNGAISLNGMPGVTILLNGQLTNMPPENLYQLLKSLAVSRMKNVEIMYSAPAKYHVSGGAINIVLLTPKALDGMTGQLTTGYDQTRYPSFSTGLGATYATDAWTFDLNLTASSNRTYNRQMTLSDHTVGTTTYSIDDNMRQTSRKWSDIIYASIGFKTLKVTYNGQIISRLRSQSFSSGSFGDYVNTYRGLSPTGFHNIDISYDTPFGLSTGADYTRYHEHRSQHLTRYEEAKASATNRQSINRYHAYVDMRHSIGNWEINYGVEYQHADDYSSQQFLTPRKEGFDNTLTEDVADIYVGTQGSSPWGLSLSASAKAEYFHNGYRHNWNFIPQLGATFFSTPASIFQLNLSTRRIYPSYWELHGGTSYISDYSSIIGNTALQPYISYSGQFNYIFRQKYAATIYMHHSDGYSVQLPYQSPDELKLIFQTLNLDYSSTLGIQLHIPFNIGDIWDATATVNVSRKREKASRFHDIDFDNSRWGLYASLSNSFRPVRSWPLAFSADVSYIGGMIQGPGNFDPLWKVDAGIKLEFGRKRCCVITCKATDLLDTCNPRMTIRANGQAYRMNSYHMNRSLGITFQWRFNGFKPKDTAIDTSRFGTVR